MRVAALVVACLPACAWGPGEPFGEVTVELTARWQVPAGRDLGGGWQKLASDFAVRVDAASLPARSLDLVAAATAALNFDPAHPPPGYTLCHNGHCHTADGRLVSYEDIAAEIAGGAPPAAVVSFALIAPLELIAGTMAVLDCGGPCTLPQTRIGKVKLDLTGVTAAGLVRDTREPPRFAGERPWRAAVTFDHVVPIASAVDLPVDRTSSPEIRLAAELAASAAVLDGVRWDVLATAPGEIALTADPPSVEAARAALGEVALTTTVSRSD